MLGSSILTWLSLSILDDLWLPSQAQDLFAQAKLIRSGADRDLVQAMKSVQDLQAKPTASQNQFHAFYDAVTPILASICHREDRELGLGGLIPLIPSLFMIL